MLNCFEYFFLLSGGKPLTPWTAWGQCSVSCGTGEQTRFRECDLTPAEQIQFNCTFKDKQQQTCKMQDCPSMHQNLFFESNY